MFVRNEKVKKQLTPTKSIRVASLDKYPVTPTQSATILASYLKFVQQTTIRNLDLTNLGVKMHLIYESVDESREQI